MRALNDAFPRLGNQLDWIQQNSIYIPDYNTGDYIKYKNERQKRMTFLVNTLYKVLYGQLLAADEKRF